MKLNKSRLERLNHYSLGPNCAVLDCVYLRGDADSELDKALYGRSIVGKVRRAVEGLVKTISGDYINS